MSNLENCLDVMERLMKEFDEQEKRRKVGLLIEECREKSKALSEEIEKIVREH